MNRCVIIICCVLCLMSSCGTQKVVSQDRQTDLYTTWQDSTQLRMQVDRWVSESLEQIINREIEQNITVTKLLWSEPDTSGKQYIREEMVIDAIVTTHETKTTDQQQVDQVSAVIDSTTVADSSAVVAVQSIIREREKPPWLPKSLLIIGFAIIVLFGMRLLMRWK